MLICFIVPLLKCLSKSHSSILKSLITSILFWFFFFILCFEIIHALTNLISKFYRSVYIGNHGSLIVLVVGVFGGGGGVVP